MRRSFRRVGAALAALGVLTGTGGPAAAASGSVRNGVVFSTPSGTRAQQDAIETRLIQLINGAARGSTIQLATYFLRDGAVVDALIKAHFNDLAAMRKNPNYYRTFNAGAVKTFFFPRKGTTPWQAATDDVYQVLKNVKCTGNKKVGTADHRTIVRVNMFELNRADVAHKLFDLDAKGCYVELIYSAMSRTAETILTAKAGKYHGPVLRCSKFTYPVRDDRGRPILDPNGKPKKQGAFTHDKYILIEGVYYGQKDKKIILAGSHNLSYSALRENDETLLRIDSPALYDAYRADFGGVRAQMAKYHSAPIAGCHSPGEDRQVRRYLPTPAEQELERELQDEYEN
jgi:phosphatidylserine/phosphatidylglycerophosphate/cardiolipin synthase-like enzyme